MKNIITTLALSSLLFMTSCNPDCDSVSGLQVTTRHASEGDQIVLTAQPVSSLEGRSVFINDIQAETKFDEKMGLVVTIPEGEGLNGNVELRVQDPDCVDFIPLNFNVEDEAFFIDNPQYIFPAIPEIIIPNLPQDFPPSIENAWLNIKNIDYCIWFTLLADNTGNCLRIIDPAESFEQSTCYTTNPDVNLLYKQNPMSGYIDADNNVFLTIHRSGGEEHFVGRMVHLDDMPDKYKIWTFDAPADCNPGLPPDSAGPNPARDHMMVLTSQENGRQLVIYQQVIDKVEPNCNG